MLPRVEIIVSFRWSFSIVDGSGFIRGRVLIITFYSAGGTKCLTRSYIWRGLLVEIHDGFGYLDLGVVVGESIGVQVLAVAVTVLLN